jgi:hypothetical protein
MDMKRQKNEALNDLEEEAMENANHLLEKANEQVQEQEDEIKYLNEVRRVSEEDPESGEAGLPRSDTLYF